MNRARWQDDGAYVMGVGAQTPVGRTALRAAAAVRCGHSAYREHPFMIDRHGEPMVVAMADWLPEVASPQDRMIRMGTDATIDAIRNANLKTKDISLELILAISSRTFPSEASRTQFAQAIATELRTVGIAARCYICAEGNAVGAQAIHATVEMLTAGSENVFVVLGVDSHIGPEQLEAIDYAGSLHSTNYSWGFTPGEGAGAVVLTTGRRLNRANIDPLAQVSAVATGSETKLLGTKTVCIGEGLTQAFRGALSEQEKVHHSYCDLNGETYRADEFGFAVCRTGEGFQDAGSFTAAAQSWGDVGAASVPLQIALATSAWSRGFATGSHVLCWSSSATSSLRGAVRLSNTWYEGGMA